MSASGLMNFDEMKQRYDQGGDSLELTVEKWERIFSFSKTVFCLDQFQDMLHAAVVPIFLCAEYANQCHLCPIYALCEQGNSSDWRDLIRVLHAYAVAGDLLPKDPLLEQLNRFVGKLQDCRSVVLGKAH